MNLKSIIKTILIAFYLVEHHSAEKIEVIKPVLRFHIEQMKNWKSSNL